MVNKSNFRRSREKIEQLFDSIETQIWHLIDSRTYGYANRAHAEFFGLKVEDMEFRDIYSFISKKEADVCLESNKKIYNQKAQNVSEEWIKNANGQLRLLKITKAPILDDDNNVEMIICTAEDITEKKSWKGRNF